MREQEDEGGFAMSLRSEPAARRVLAKLTDLIKSEAEQACDEWECSTPQEIQEGYARMIQLIGLEIITRAVMSHYAIRLRREDAQHAVKEVLDGLSMTVRVIDERISSERN